MLFVDMKIYKASQRSLICLSQVPPANSCHFLKSNQKPLLLRHNLPVVLSNEATSVSPLRNTYGEWLKVPEVKDKS